MVRVIGGADVMKLVDGYYLPAAEERIEEVLKDSIALGRPAYQHHKVEAAVARTERRRNALDVGSHIGMWSMQLLRLGFEHVHAFEPDESKWGCSLKNVRNHAADLAGLERSGGFERLTRYDFGLGAADERVELVHKAGTSLKTHVRVGDTGSLRLRRLDDLGLTDIDFIKIDVEGFELFVVRGAEATIRRDRPVIIVEQKKDVATKRYGIGDQDALRLLESWGYEIVEEFNGDFVMVHAG